MNVRKFGPVVHRIERGRPKSDVGGSIPSRAALLCPEDLKSFLPSGLPVTSYF